MLVSSYSQKLQTGTVSAVKNITYELVFDCEVIFDFSKSKV